MYRTKQYITIHNIYTHSVGQALGTEGGCLRSSNRPARASSIWVNDQQPALAAFFFEVPPLED